LQARKVADLLATRKATGEVISADVGENVVQVVTKMKNSGVSQLPVYSNEQIVGILDETDLLEPLVKGSLKLTEPIIHLVRGSVVYVDREDDLASLNEHFLKGYVALVKEKDRLQIVTKIDLLQYLGQMGEML
jgi:predicted transcriptional regulator